MNKDDPRHPIRIHSGKSTMFHLKYSSPELKYSVKRSLSIYIFPLVMVINLIQIMFRGAERFGNSGGVPDKVIS